MQGNNDTVLAVIKSCIAWFLVFVGSLTATKLATYLAIGYTGLQIFVTVRDKIINRKEQP